MKGKPWTVEEEKQLRTMVQNRKSIKVVAETLGKTENAVRQKMIKLELKEEKKSRRKCFSSSNQLPSELPNMEKQLKVLAGALATLQTQGLDREETLRLRSIIDGVKVYEELLANYLGFCGLEKRLFELETKYEELTRSKAKSPQTGT